MRAAERSAGLGEALTTAVARSYHKLIAVKDEWEVARLFASPDFQRALSREFEGPYKLHFHIGAWPFARPDPQTGVMGKGEAGPWAMTAFRVMARLRVPAREHGSIRSAISDERKLERRLLAEYETDIDDMLARLAPANARAHCSHREPAGDDQGLRAGQGGERRRGGESARQALQQLRAKKTPMELAA